MEKLSSYLGFEAQYIIYPILVLLAGMVVRYIVRKFAQRWADKTENTLDNQIVAYVNSIVTPLVLLAMFYGLSHWLPIPPKSLRYLQKGLLVVIVFLLAYFTSRLIVSILVYASQRNEGLSRFLQPIQALTKIFFVLAAAALSFRILNINISSDGIRFIRIIGISAGAYIVLRILRLAVNEVEQYVRQKDAAALEAQKRAATLGKIINNAAAVLVISVSAMMVLSEFGMNITPIITGAGIVGLAVGFGAQNLVRDVISGFFIILEDQLRVGDVAKINGTGGTVEAIRLRTTLLRDGQGTVHIFPNGEIKQVANQTKEYSYCVVDVGVAYKENVDQVMELLRQIGGELQQDPKFSSAILAPIEVLGLESFGDSQVTIRTRIKTIPLQQWAVGRELRRRIKNSFDHHNIEIPFPHLSVFFKREQQLKS